MPVDIGPKIGIQGEREFRNQINQTNQALKTLAAEGKAVTSSFDAETTAEQKAAAQKDVLNRKIETQKDKLALLEKGLRESAQMYGEADTRTMKWQQAVHEATAQLNGMEKELQDVDKNVDETADSMDDAGEATKGWADVMKGQLLADAVKTGLKKIADFAKDAASAMWDASKAGAAYADDILTLATTTGLSTDELQEYKYMADLVDVSLETVTGSLTKLTSSMGKAASGEGDMADAFRDLGVSVKDSNGKLRKSKDVFRDVIDALGKIDDETERDVKAMQIFGKSAKDLNPMIAAGADEMDALAKEAHDAGYVLSGPALTALGKQQDAMERVSKKAEALKNTFASKLAPGITKAYDKIGETMDNPRVQRSVELLGEGIGNIIGKAADLASKVLPDLMAAFSNDTKLLYYTDRQLELAKAIDDAAEAHANAMNEYKTNAVGILEETQRTKDLWKELQTLVEENGKVKDGQEERVDYILHVLNDALGTEYERNGDIIEQYAKMQEGIDGLIQKRTAERLLEANADAYAQAVEDRNAALEREGEAYENLLEAQQKLADAEAAHQKKIEEADAGKNGDIDRFKFLSKTRVELEKAQRVYNSMLADYDKAHETTTRAYEEIDRYERAQTAALQNNYAETTRILTDEFGVTLEYYRKKKDLNEKEKKDLADKIRQQEYQITAYKENLKAGLAGFSESGLKEMQSYVDKARLILDGKAVADQWIDGMVIGLTDKQNRARVAAAAAAVAELVPKEARRTMEIRSPSHLAEWMTTMWDEGLIKGLEKKKAEVAAASASVSAGIAALGAPKLNGYSYGNAMTAVGGVANNSTSSYTTNMGGITVRIDGAGAVNEDVLAQRVAVRLTNELQRAQRGGRR